MKITIWGCRGSLPSPGPEKNRYGGNTSCVQVEYNDSCLILDGGSGIQRLGVSMPKEQKEVNILLTHLHLDHIMGLGFFQPLYNPNVTVNIYGPAGTSESLVHRLRRYFSPPLFPVRLNELPCKLNIIEIDHSDFKIDDFHISSEYICHPGPTVGFRVKCNDNIFAYMPDHEPALGSSDFPNIPAWTSGYNIAQNADLLFHDAQYKNHEYKNSIGWGHSSMEDAIKFSILCNVDKMVMFHHDPSHTDIQLEELYRETKAGMDIPFEVELGEEGKSYQL
jgi:phosphoribosyl 1,2-cyclic phosphodiesterase